MEPVERLNVTEVIDGLAFGRYQHMRPMVPADVLETVAACAQPALPRLSVTVPFSEPLAPYSHVHAISPSLDDGVIVAEGFPVNADALAVPVGAMLAGAVAYKYGLMIRLLT